VLDGIFLGFWKEEFFSLQLHIFFPKILIRGRTIKNSLTISAIEHFFKFLEREFHCEYFMFYKFVDIMSRSWGKLKATLASEWTSGVILKWQKMAKTANCASFIF